MTIFSGTFGGGGSGGGGGLIDVPVSFLNSPVTATAGYSYSVDTSGGAVTVNLPTGSAGARIGFKDALTTFGSNNLTVIPNGSETITGESSLVFDADRANAVLAWSVAGNQWVFESAESFVNPEPLNQIISTAKPTTRVGGSALVIGDRWWKNDDGTTWFWNGTYWLSMVVLPSGFRSSVSSYSAPQSALGVSGSHVPAIEGQVMIIGARVSCRIDSGGINDANNYWSFKITGNKGGSNSASLPSPVILSTQGKTYAQFNSVVLTSSLNQVLDVASIASYRTMALELTSTGSPSALSDLTASFLFRNIAP